MTVRIPTADSGPERAYDDPPHLSAIDRLRELVALRDWIKRAPVRLRRELKHGPREEPTCGVCSAIAAVDGCASYGETIRDYHEVGIFDLAQLLGEDDLGKVAEMCTDAAEPLIRALAGALAAERCLTIYLLAGWRPPDGLRPEFIGRSGARA